MADYGPSRSFEGTREADAINPNSLRTALSCIMLHEEDCTSAEWQSFHLLSETVLSHSLVVLVGSATIGFDALDLFGRQGHLLSKL